MITSTSTATSFGSGSPHDPAPVRTALLWGSVVVAISGIAGAFVVTRLVQHGYSVPKPQSDVFFRLYALHERPFFVLLAFFAALVWIYARSAASAEDRQIPDLVQPTARVRSSAALLATAAAVGLFAGVGSHFFLHDLPVSADEYNAIFQAKIFAAGRVTASIPSAWQPFGPALTPVWVTYYPDVHGWRSGYLPVYAAIRTLFGFIGIGRLTNPILGALTILVLAAVGRLLWPGRPQRSALSVLFLVTSTQFLFMSMTWYSMPAHLLLNIVWLWLYLRDDRLSLALLPLVGVLALGLHNPFPHALFVAPFLIRMLRRRRFAWLGYAAAVYGAGCIVWLSWMRHSYSYQSGGGLVSRFALPGAWELRIQVSQLSLILSWQAPIVAIAALVALFLWRRLGDTERDLTAGMILTAGFFFLFPDSQAHGWGDRYFYGALGNLVILAAIGADLSAEGLGQIRIGRIIAASTLVALLVQLPLRAIQVERFVRPFARATEYVATRPEPVVVVYTDSSYYGQDLVRNDPFLRNSPKILAAGALGDSGMRRLRAQFGQGVHEVRPAELGALGIPIF